MKKYVKASYEDDFWRLHDRDMETGTALEAIIDKQGWEDRFFPEDDSYPTASESDYKAVLDAYSGAEVNSASVEDVLEDVRLHMKSMPGIRNVDYIDSINALRFTLSNGHTYQFVVQDLKGL